MNVTTMLAAASAKIATVGGLSFPISYRRGNWQTELVAQRGQTELEITDAYGVTFLARTDDWLCDTADLLIAGRHTRPEPGDRIVHTLDGRQETYEVGHPAAGDPYRLAGPNRQRLRIHTRLIETSP